MTKFICNSFQVPNALVDELMAEMSGIALKCYLLITRKTAGWGKSTDRISISQFIEYAGVKDNRTIHSALEELTGLGLIKSVKSKGQITEFSLITEQQEVVTKNTTTVVAKNVPTKNVGSDNFCRGVVAKNDTGSSSKKCHSTKDTIKNTITKENIYIRNGLDLSVFNQQPSDQVWNDFIKHRKNKKAVLTQTALNRLAKKLNQANQLGYSTDDVLSIIQERNWTAFEVEWLSNSAVKNKSKLVSENYKSCDPVGFQ